jgi:hypothetical protein
MYPHYVTAAAENASFSTSRDRPYIDAAGAYLLYLPVNIKQNERDCIIIRESMREKGREKAQLSVSYGKWTAPTNHSHDQDRPSPVAPNSFNCCSKTRHPYMTFS